MYELQEMIELEINAKYQVVDFFFEKITHNLNRLDRGELCCNPKEIHVVIFEKASSELNLAPQPEGYC